MQRMSLALYYLISFIIWYHLSICFWRSLSPDVDRLQFLSSPTRDHDDKGRWDLSFSKNLRVTLGQFLPKMSFRCFIKFITFPEPGITSGIWSRKYTYQFWIACSRFIWICSRGLIYYFFWVVVLRSLFLSLFLKYILLCWMFCCSLGQRFFMGVVFHP